MNRKIKTHILYLFTAEEWEVCDTEERFPQIESSFDVLIFNTKEETIEREWNPGPFI